MTNEAQQSLNQRLAEALDAAGHPEVVWDSAKSCPQGDSNSVIIPMGGMEEYSVGQLCFTCCVRQYPKWTFLDALRQARADIRDHDSDPTWHPEWRFRRVPKDFFDATTLLAAVHAYCRQEDGRRYGMGYQQKWETETQWPWRGWAMVDNVNRRYEREGATEVEALAKAFLAALTAKGDEA